jgi:hypothetical protein
MFSNVIYVILLSKAAFVRVGYESEVRNLYRAPSSIKSWILLVLGLSKP